MIDQNFFIFELSITVKAADPNLFDLPFLLLVSAHMEVKSYKREM